MILGKYKKGAFNPCLEVGESFLENVCAISCLCDLCFSLSLSLSLSRRERGREGEREKNINWLLPIHPDGDRTCNILVFEMMLQPSEPPGQGEKADVR